MPITAWPTHTPSGGLLTPKPALQGPRELLQEGHLTKASSDVISSATCALWDLAEQRGAVSIRCLSRNWKLGMESVVALE